MQSSALSPENKWKYRSEVGRLLDIAYDMLDMQFVSKDLARQANRSTDLSMTKLKRAIELLRDHPKLEAMDEEENMPTCLLTPVDSD